MNSVRFYFDGLFYSTKEEFEKAVYNYANSEISPVSAARILKEMCDCIEMNVFIGDQNKGITNSQLKEIAEETIIYFISKYRNLFQS